jgi:DNA-binding transcriptional MerR regulator
MNAFSIRDIENLCGIRAHTLRVWEQRYQLVRPKRKAGNHRTYDNDQLRYLLRISFLYYRGHKISKLVRLGEQELGRLILAIAQPANTNEIFINQLLEASLEFDHDLFDRILHNIILHLGFEKAVTGVVFPYLQKIGLFWLTGNLVPGQEHFASALITKKLIVAINGLETPAPPPGEGGKHVLLYTPTGEFHEIPLLYMRYLMKKSGVPTVYFGSNVAIEDLRHYCNSRPVTHLYFHLVTQLLHCEPDQYIRRLTNTFPDKVLVLSGSLGAGLRGHYPRLRLLSGLAEMEAFAKERYFFGNT